MNWIVQKVRPKVPGRTRTRRSCAGTARRRDIELPIAARNRRTTTKDSRRVRRKATAKEKATRTSSRASATIVASQVTCQGL